MLIILAIIDLFTKKKNECIACGTYHAEEYCPCCGSSIEGMLN